MGVEPKSPQLARDLEFEAAAQMPDGIGKLRDRCWRFDNGSKNHCPMPASGSGGQSLRKVRPALLKCQRANCKCYFPALAFGLDTKFAVA